jgi:hypothetical protein
MSAYQKEHELAIRTARQVHDWAKSGLISAEQRDQMLPELAVDLRRTNKFLRVTLFLFGLMIIQSLAGLLAITIGSADEVAAGALCGAVAAGSFWTANMLITRYKLYRFGVEEAPAIASIILTGAAVLLLAMIGGSDRALDLPITMALLAASGVAFALFRQFGFVYGAVIAMMLATAAAFVPGNSDVAHRIVAAMLLAVCFALGRSARQRHGLEFPGDNYAIIEAAAWIGLYCVVNLQISQWLSARDAGTPFYWSTYVLTWALPAAGLWLAIHDRHRLLLDVNVAMAIVTLMTNKAYLGTPRQPYDPVAFGLLLIVVAIGVRRWLAGGKDGSRGGYIAERLLASEKERLGVVGTFSVVHQGPVAEPAAAPEPPPVGGGGRSGGAGAAGNF